MHHAHHHGTVPGLAAPERLQDHDHVDLAPLGAAAAPPAGLIQHQKDETHRLAGAVGFSGQGAADTRDCANTTAQRKHFATLAARLALAGWVLHRTAANDGPVRFYVTRWGMGRDLASLDAVAAFADRVGAP